MSNNYDVIIIGAGVVGCSIACALSRRGIRSLNLDPLPAAGYGSTSYSSAIIRPFYSHLTSCAVAHESRALWLSWHEQHKGPDPAATYIESGGLVLVREGAENEYQNNLDVLNAVGVVFEILDADQLATRHPGICLDAFGPPCNAESDRFGSPVEGSISKAIYMPEAGYVTDPQLATRNLQQTAASMGATFRFQTQVTGIEQTNGCVEGVICENGERYNAPVIVNAAGPHSFAINALADIELPIKTRPHRHEVAHVSAPASYQQNPGFIADMDAGVYQKPDGNDVVIGSTDPACDNPDIVDPDSYSESLSSQWTTQVYRAAQRWPDLAIENSARGVVGLYDVSDDWIPIYDQTDLSGYYVAIGTSGNQFKNAPVIGDIMASIIAAADHDRAPAALRLDNIQMEIDLGFFSRHREVQKTASVMA